MLLVGVVCPLAVVAQAVSADGSKPVENQAMERQLPENALPGAQTRLIGRTVEQVEVHGARNSIGTAQPA